MSDSRTAIDSPDPLTPPDCDLRDFAFMPLDVVRLRDSDLAVTADADEFRCAVLLWCASWHQVPAASLPDDDKALAQYAGYGRVVKEWLKVRTGALRGWVKCTDGRLYHPVVAEKAAEAWLAKLRQRLRTECSRIKKHNERHGTRIPFPEFDAWMQTGCPVGQPLFVPSDKNDIHAGHPALVTGENHSNRQGEGQGQGNNKNKSSSSQPPALRDDDSSFPSPQKSERSSQVVALLLAHDIVTTSQNPVVLSWSQDSQITDEVLRIAIAKARKTKGGEEIVPKYLAKAIATVLDEQNTAVPAAPARSGAGQAVQVQPNRKPQGADPKGTDESYAEYQARIDAFEAARRKALNP